MSSKLLAMVVAAGLAATWQARAADEASPAPAEPAAAKVCAACHGEDGNSPIPANPNLAGLPAAYIATQLQHFKGGVRVNPIMAAMAAPLSPEDMSALGAYFASQKPKGSAASDKQSALAGQALYRGGRVDAQTPACAACHSPDGAGIPARYPRLAGQHADYVYSQLKAFQSRQRGSNEQDVNGKVMTQVAAKLTDPDMHALAEYVSGLH